MDENGVAERILAAFNFLEGAGFVAGVDSGSRVHFESAAVRGVVVYDLGKLEVLLVLKTSAGPHSPTFYLGEVLRWKGFEVPARDMPPEALGERLLEAAEQLREHGGPLLAGDEAAFAALEALRAERGHLYGEEQRARIEAAAAALAGLGRTEGKSLEEEGTERRSGRVRQGTKC